MNVIYWNATWAGERKDSDCNPSSLLEYSLFTHEPVTCAAEIVFLQYSIKTS